LAGGPPQATFRQGPAINRFLFTKEGRMSITPSDIGAPSAAAVMDPVNVDSLDTFRLTSSTTDDAEWKAY
jgi:hypothetical protein